MRRLASVLAGLVVVGAPLVAAPPPAQAALSCAPDPYEGSADVIGGGAPIAVGGSLSRAICQDRDAGVDREFFVFDAVGGKAYSLGITAAGSGLRFGELNGLQVAGVFRIAADGSTTTIEAPNAESYERFTTPILAAGRYGFVAVDSDEVAYPDNYLGTKPVQGAAGTYTLKLTEAAPAPAVMSISVPAEIRPRTRYTGTYTLSGPAPQGGISLFPQTSTGYVSVPRVWAPAGATRGSFVIDATYPTAGARVTISLDTRVGGPASAVTTVKK